MWSVLEAVSGQRETMSGWEAKAKDAFAVLQPFLRPTQKTATGLPCPRKFCGGAVIRGEPQKFAVCGDSEVQCDPVPLEDSQCVVHELHRDLLAECLGKVLTFKAVPPEQVGDHPLWRIGTTNQAWKAKVPVVMALPGHFVSLDDLVREALIQLPAGFLFLGGNLERVSPQTRMAARNMGAGFVDLAEVLSVTGGGVFLPQGTLKEVVGLSGLAPAVTEEEGPRLERTGDSWSFHFQGKSTHVRDTLGVGYLRTLLGNPGNAVHVLRMAALHQGQNEQKGASTGQAVLDERAITSYQERLGTIAQALERAKQNNDLVLAESLEDEEEALRAELKSALGLTGRRRRMGDDTEKLRKSISRAIQRVLDTLSANHPDLGRHFHQSIRLGATLVYDPGSEIRWVLD